MVEMEGARGVDLDVGFHWILESIADPESDLNAEKSKSRMAEEFEVERATQTLDSHRRKHPWSHTLKSHKFSDS